MQTNSKVTKLGLLCGAIAPAVIVAFIIAGWLITPGYSHISDTISQLGAQGRPHPWVMNSGLIIYALLTLGFAYGVYRILGHSTGARAILFFFAIYAMCIILTAIFQIELKTPEEITNLEGTLHSVFALIAFSAMIIWMMIFARVIYNYPPWRWLAWFTLAIVAVDLAASPIFLLEATGSVEGAVQRTFVGFSLLWLEVVALWGLRIRGDAQAK